MLQTNFDDIFEEECLCAREESIIFAEDLDSFVDLGAFSTILYHQQQI